MKKKFTCAAIALASLCTLASCAQAQPVSFNAKWRKSTLDTVENVKFTGHEIAEYDVTFEQGANVYYSVEYSNGVYKTDLYSENGKYVFETALSINVKYVFNEEASEMLSDTISSRVVFESTQKGLRPIRSEKRSSVHVPASISPASLASCYAAYNTVIATDYSANTCTISYYTDSSFATKDGAADVRSFTADNQYSLIDNEELLLAVRGIVGTSTSTVYVYNTAAGQMQQVQISQGEAESTDFDFTIVGRESEGAKHEKVSYVPFTMMIKDDNSGPSQTLWIAETTDAANNAYRNVLLKMETSASYNLGTFTYSLKKVDFLDD